MITILKESPITYDGVDYLEQLVRDSECAAGQACDLCFYKDYVPAIELIAGCADVHGCTLSNKTYFRIKPL